MSTQNFFLNFQGKSTLTSLDNFSLPIGFAATLCGRPYTEGVIDPGSTLYVRALGLGGKRKKNSQKRLTGSGDYSTMAKKAARAAIGGAQRLFSDKAAQQMGRSMGAAIASSISPALGGAGGDIGAVLGLKAKTALGKRLQKLIGRGDYTIAGDTTVVNSLIRGKANSYMSFGGSHAEMTVEFREYIGDLTTQNVADSAGTSGSVLSMNTYNVNPGDPQVFPWLSNIAQNYEEYRVNGLVFEFVSTTSPYNANSAMGEIIITSQDNVSGPEITTRQGLFNTEMCSTSRLDRNLMYGVECKSAAQNWYYVSSNSTTTDTNLQNFVRVYVGSSVASSFPPYSTLGELWETYSITFRGPIVTQQLPGALFKASGSSMIPVSNASPSLIMNSPRVLTTGIFSTNNPSNFLIPNTGIGVNETSGVYSICEAPTAPNFMQFNLLGAIPGRVYEITVCLNAVYAGDNDPDPTGFPATLSLILGKNVVPYTTLTDIPSGFNSAPVFGMAVGNTVRSGTPVWTGDDSALGVYTVNQVGFTRALNPALCQAQYKFAVSMCCGSNLSSPIGTYSVGGVVHPFYGSSVWIGVVGPAGSRLDYSQLPIATTAPTDGYLGSSCIDLTVADLGTYDPVDETSLVITSGTAASGVFGITNPYRRKGQSVARSLSAVGLF